MTKQQDRKPSSKSHINALRLFKEGKQYGCSTDISGETSYGYGTLDEFGFWEFPLYFEQEPQMYICPKAKECKEAFKDERTHVHPHEKITEPIYKSCEESCFYEGCTCIPYSPQPTTCPDCGQHEWITGDSENYCEKCLKTKPADLQSEKQTGKCLSATESENCLHSPNAKDCAGCELWSPAPHMPLPPDICDGCEDGSDKCGHSDCVATQQEAIKSWLPAHDSAIAAQAVKEFADRVCEDMPLAPFIGGLNPESPEAFDLLKKGIALRQNICNWVYRAMAEKE